MQGFAAFKLNVQAAQEDREKLARAAGKFKNQRMGLAFETWKQHTQHTQLLQSCLTKAVAALVNRSLRAGFTAWRDAAALKKQHSQKVYKQIKCLQPSMSQRAFMQEGRLREVHDCVMLPLSEAQDLMDGELTISRGLRQAS